MSNRITVDTQSVPHLIHQAYMAGGPYQWVREGLVNALQAEATWVKFGIEKSGIKSRGVRRRYIADNGYGMHRDDVDSFLAKFGGGGRPISDHENFGQGFKASCFEWNPFGIIVLTWTRDEPEGTMVWIATEDENAGGPRNWIMKEFQVFEKNEQGEEILSSIEYKVAPDREVLSRVGIDLDEVHFPEIREANQGTVFIFLGDHEYRDTANGDYLRGNEESKRGIVNYINTRFLEIPADVQVLVENIEAKGHTEKRRDSKDTYIIDPEGNKVGLHSRRPKGLLGFVPKKSVCGELNLDCNTKATWYLSENAGVEGGDGPAKPVIALKYDDEAYEVLNTITDYRLFGIQDVVRERVWLIIEPPKFDPSKRGEWGVVPQGSRGSLIGEGGHKLPWRDWQDSFDKQLPREIREAIDDSRTEISSSSTEERRKTLKRTMSRFVNRFKPEMVVESRKGSHRGLDTGTTTGENRDTGESITKSENPVEPVRDKDPSGGTGPLRVLRESVEGDRVGDLRRRGDGLPAVVWDLSFEEGDDRYAAARFDEKDRIPFDDGTYSDGVIHMNPKFPMFVSEFKYWEARYFKAGEGQVEKVVKEVYEDEVVSKVLHARKLNTAEVARDASGQAVRVPKAQVEKWLSAECLTTALMGLVNVEYRISQRLSGMYGAARN